VAVPDASEKISDAHVANCRAITAKHLWLVIACDSCETVLDLDLRVKPRDLDASIRVALRDVRCSRCNGYGRPWIVRLAQHPSICNQPLCVS
jgi:hypothetical protein